MWYDPCGSSDMENNALLLQYLFPLAALCLLLFALCVRSRALGGPVGLFLCFFLILFTPNMVYAAVADDLSAELFLVSPALACICSGCLGFELYLKKRPGGE